MSFNAAALKMMLDKGLTLDDVVEIAAANETRSKGAERQARYRERKDAQSDVTRDVTPAPNDIYLTPTPEKPEAKASVKNPNLQQENRAAIGSCLHKAFKLAVEIPEWMPPSYAEFRSMRKAMRNVPFGEGAERRVIAKIAKARAEGHDPEKLLSKAIENGHRTVFPDESTKAGKATGKVELTAQQWRERAEQQARFGRFDSAEECRRRAVELEQRAAA